MLDWLRTNADVISALASVATIFVWLAYFQLMYGQYSNSRKPRIYIQQGPSFDIDATCQIVNMSPQYLDVLCVIMCATVDGKTFSRTLNGYDTPGGDREPAGNLEQVYERGALPPGGAARLGSFGQLMKHVATAAPDGIDLGYDVAGIADRIDELEVRVVAMFGVENRPIGASRKFSIWVDGETAAVKPATLHSVQMNKRWQRNTVDHWFEDCLEESRPHRSGGRPG